MRSAYERALSPDQRQAAQLWLREMADRLLLQDWWISVGARPPEGFDHDAEVEVIGSHQEAIIYLDARMFSEPDRPAYVAKIMIHELVHLHHSDMNDALADLVVDLGDTLAKLHELTLSRYRERLVDNIARAIVGAVGHPDLDPLFDAEPLAVPAEG